MKVLRFQVESLQFFFLSQRIIALQHCVGFCCTTQTTYNYTYIPSLGKNLLRFGCYLFFFFYFISYQSFILSFHSTPFPPYFFVVALAYSDHTHASGPLYYFLYSQCSFPLILAWMAPSLPLIPNLIQAVIKIEALHFSGLPLQKIQKVASDRQASDSLSKL